MAMFTIKKLIGFSQGVRFVNNYCYKGIPKQRNDEYQAVRKGFSNFCCCRIKRIEWSSRIHSPLCSYLMVF